MMMMKGDPWEDPEAQVQAGRSPVSVGKAARRGSSAVNRSSVRLVFSAAGAACSAFAQAQRLPAASCAAGTCFAALSARGPPPATRAARPPPPA